MGSLPPPTYCPDVLEVEQQEPDDEESTGWLVGGQQGSSSSASAALAATAVAHRSLDGMFQSVPVTTDSTWRAKYAAFFGVGAMVAVGYLDPGNWATDLIGGAKYGYLLLSVILLASLSGMFLQCLSLKLGVATGRDLAQACRDAYPRRVVISLWVLMEVAIAATDLAEVIGSATALYLLFGLPMWVGVLLTGADVLLLLAMTANGIRRLETICLFLVLLIAACFAVELAAAKPDWRLVGLGLLPSTAVFTEPGALYVAVGILGATVMPHNLFLHSSTIQTRAYPRTAAGRSMAIHFGRIDAVIALFFAFYVNAAILVLAAAAFHYSENPTEVSDIDQAYRLLADALGTWAAQVLFGVSLLAAGQSSSITGTVAGQIVMSGFLHMRVQPWIRRLVTRSVSIVPAVIVAAVGGNSGAGSLLVLSQVILSLTLCFAAFPLVHLTGCPQKMGRYVNGRVESAIAWTLCAVIASLNVFLVGQFMVGG